MQTGQHRATSAPFIALCSICGIVCKNNCFFRNSHLVSFIMKNEFLFNDHFSVCLEFCIFSEKCSKSQLLKNFNDPHAQFNFIVRESDASSDQTSYLHGNRIDINIIICAKPSRYVCFLR